MNRRNYFKLIGVVLCLGIAGGLIAQGNTQPPIEQIASFGNHIAIGMTVNSENRVFVSFPNYDADGSYALAELVEGKLHPYPDQSWNTKDIVGAHHFVRVQDLYVDSKDYLWVLDSKPAPASDIFKSASNAQKTGYFSLIKINTKSGKVERTYDFKDLDKSVSALNDVRVDPISNTAYLSDPGQAAIVVLDLKTGRSRSILKKTAYTLADTVVLRYDGKEMRDKAGHPFVSNINGIALTHDGHYFYFKPINQDYLFRIDTKYLKDTSISKRDLAANVEKVAKVGVTHGLIAAKNGNIYMTTSERYSISYLTPTGELKQLVKDKNLLWPDSMGIGSDGYLYISCSQLQLLPTWNNGIDKTDYPYKAFRVKLISQ